MSSEEHPSAADQWEVSKPTITFSSPDDEDYAETLHVTRIGPDEYLLEDSPTFSDVAAWHDVIRCVSDREGTLRCTEVVRRSGFVVKRLMLSRQYAASPLLSKLKDDVVRWGGNWEQIFGGIFLLHLPPEREAEAMAFFNSIGDEAAE